MTSKLFPIIDVRATGRNIARMRREHGLSVRDMQSYFGFENPQAIYHWLQGKALPSLDHLYALSALLGVSMDSIVVQAKYRLNIVSKERLHDKGCSIQFYRLFWNHTLAAFVPDRVIYPFEVGYVDE